METAITPQMPQQFNTQGRKLLDVIDQGLNIFFLDPQHFSTKRHP